jgi:hypothetical protein
LLWEDEEQLRALCRELWVRLSLSNKEKEILVAEALDYGFREGYARAVIQLSYETKEGDATCYLLH